MSAMHAVLPHETLSRTKFALGSSSCKSALSDFSASGAQLASRGSRRRRSISAAVSSGVGGARPSFSRVSISRRRSSSVFAGSRGAFCSGGFTGRELELHAALAVGCMAMAIALRSANA